MTCPKVDTGRHNLRCPNSEQQSYLNSNNDTFPMELACVGAKDRAACERGIDTFVFVE